MENKEEIIKYLTLLLSVTRAGSDVADLILNERQDKVTILFKQGGRREVNIAGDSGIAIIRDVVGKI